MAIWDGSTVLAGAMKLILEMPHIDYLTSVDEVLAYGWNQLPEPVTLPDFERFLESDIIVEMHA